MAKKRRRRRRRNSGSFLIGFICVLILLLVLGLIVHIISQRNRHDSVLTAPVATLASDDSAAAVGVFAANEPQTMEGIVGIDPLPELTPEPTEALVLETPEPTPEPTPTPEPVQAATFDYLPIYETADITDKRIAITVDDCFQMENLKTIARVTYKNNGKLTLFPIGENVVRDGMDEILQVCYNQLGFEIENHTWSHARIFRLSEAEMAAEIWKQRQAVSKALGVNYQEHFFRLMGGDGAYDQRTHNYLKQLGFRGIASWSWSGSDASLEQSEEVLKPGMVYLFHTTDRDTAILKEFIPYCVSKGYKLVTLNELFGLPANEVSDISTLEAEMPAPQPYAVVYHDEQNGDYSWAVVRIQERLHELGYLGDGAKSAVKNSVADGVFGDGTADAVSRFQADNGLPATGIADPVTQMKLFEGIDDPSGEPSA